MKRFLILCLIFFCAGSSIGQAQQIKFGFRLGLGIPDIIGAWSQIKLSDQLEVRALISGMPLLVFNVGVFQADLIYRAGNGFYIGGGGGMLVLNTVYSALFGLTPFQTTVIGFVDILAGYQVPISKSTSFYLEMRPVALFYAPLPIFLFLGAGFDFTF